MKIHAFSPIVATAAVLLACAASAVERVVWPTEQAGLSGPQQLTNALKQAASGDVIVVKPGTYDLSSVWMSTESFSGGTGTNHLAVMTACEIRGETTGHWDDAVTFTGKWRGLRVAADVAVKVSGITFQGFTGGTWTGNGTTSADCSGAGVKFYAQYDEGNANRGRGCYLSNCVIRACSSAHGAAVYGGLAIDCLIERNTGKVASSGYRTRVEKCLFRDNHSTVYYGFQDTVGAYDTIFTNNTSASYGAGICLHGTTYAGASPCVISNCQFLGNSTVNTTGAALSLENIFTANAPKLMDCVFRANRNGGGNTGDAIGCSGQGGNFRLTIDRCTFDSHRGSGHVVRGNGAISVFVLTDCVFTNNYVTAAGSAINNASVYATNCTFVANEADGGNAGGAVCVAAGATGFFKGCTFRTNTSYDGGSLYYVATAKGGAEDCVFEGCNGRRNGGAVKCDSVASNLFVRCRYLNGRCTSAKADNGLGGAGVSGGVHSNCVFTGNSCSLASAIARGVAIDCVITNNPATGNPSGVALKSQLVRCEISNGGIWFCSLDRCNIHDAPAANPNCVFFGANWATNCLVTKCMGTWGNWYRGADSYTFMAGEGPATVGEYVNCTFADNCHVTNYRMVCYDGSKTYSNRFENCIFYGNHNGNSFAGGADDFSLYKNSGIAVGVVTNCIIGTKGPIDVPATQYIDLGGVRLGVDPLYAKDTKPGVLDYYGIQKRSPARDLVTPAPWMATATDLAGSNRVFGAKCDLGCYEYALPNLGIFLIVR